jgi:hypothetical protein
MRIIVVGDQFWPCHKLAAGILRRLVVRHGPHIVIVHGDHTEVAESFATAARGQRIKTEERIRLSAGLAPRLAGWRLGLDDVRGGGLGRVGGILEGRGQLLLQLLDGGLQSGELSAQGVDFGLQSLAIGTGRHCVGIHDCRVYAACAGDSTL